MDSTKSYRDLFEKSPDAILIMEGAAFIDCNPAAARMLRYPSKEALLKEYARHPANISPPQQPDGRDSFEKAEENLAITFERGSHTFEWLHSCADGEPLLVEVQLTVVRRSPGPLLHVVWRDISERKRLETELRRAQRLEAVGRLAGGVAHDFNNLLVVILGYAEMLQTEFKRGKPRAQNVDKIRTAAEKAAELTRQLLTFSRGRPSQMRPTDVGGLVRSLSDMIRRLVGENIAFALELDDDDATRTARVDPTLLEQVVMNLVANSRDAMPQGGKLKIRVGPSTMPGVEHDKQARARNFVSLNVSDDGRGMTPEEIDRAFDPFFSTKSIDEGTGLGLATVYAIAQQHGGDARIKSRPGQGTTIEVLLPHCEERPVAAPPVRPPANATSGAGKTVLLVEDEAPIRRLFEGALLESGYRVIAASEGSHALELVESCPDDIDIVVTDVVMPHMSGPELVHQLLRRLPDLPVVYISGYSTEQSLSVPEPSDAVVLQKPFSPQVLLSQVGQALGQRRKAPASRESAFVAPEDS